RGTRGGRRVRAHRHRDDRVVPAAARRAARRLGLARAAGCRPVRHGCGDRGGAPGHDAVARHAARGDAGHHDRAGRGAPGRPHHPRHLLGRHGARRLRSRREPGGVPQAAVVRRGRALLPRCPARDGADPAGARRAARASGAPHHPPPPRPRRADPLLRRARGGRMSDLVHAVLAAADRTPDDAALTARGRTWSYRELARRIRAIAASLRAEGLASGDRVLFSVRPGPDAVALALGIVGAGGTVVFADPGAGEALFRARAQLAAPRWVAAESLLYLASSGPLRGLARRRGLELAPYARLVPDARHIRAGGWLPGVPARALALARLAAGDADGIVTGHADDAALVVFTSGTTDAPKAVVHTRGSLGAGLTDFADGVGIRAGLRVLTDQLMVGVPALIGGAHWTMPTPGLDPGARRSEEH